MHNRRKQLAYTLDRQSALVYIWSFGLCLGLIMCRFYGASLVRVLQGAVYNKVTFAVFATILPLVLAMISVHFLMPELVYPLAFMKAFLDGIFLFAVGKAFVGASWLIFWLLFFSDRFTTVLFLWFSFRHLNQNSFSINRDCFLASFLSLSAILFDYFLISPWLYTLMTHN